jgi:serine/threonine protein kinase
MSAASDLPAKIASRYLPVRLIGKGGMGVVYEVVHAHTGEHLALKVLQGSAGAPAEALDRFKREARAPAQIRSENVVRVSDADVAPELDDAPFIVMELLDGLNLEQAAARSKPDPTTVVGWLRQIAPALDKAHRLGIIHRDLKPENLFLATVDGRPPVVKILDFGIAKMAEEGSAATVSGQVLGTPKYMAPEQAARHPRVTPATDRYALGLITYRLLVGESYHRGAVMSILAEVMHGAPSAPSTRNPSLGPAFDAWFLQACHREPERRFDSAGRSARRGARLAGERPRGRGARGD